MKTHTIASVIGLSLCFGASLVEAQQPQYYWTFPEGAGPYFRLGAGPSFFQNGTLREFAFEGSAPFSAQNQPVKFDTGVAFGAAMGYAFDQYFSLDFETGYIWARINHIPGYIVNDSSIGNVPLLVNATVSLPIPHTNIVPYIGGGAGGAITEFDADSFSDSAQTVTAFGTDSDAVFAYQAFAGVRFLITPNFSLGLGYKYFATGNPAFSYPPSPNLDIGFHGVHTHSVMATLQWNF